MILEALQSLTAGADLPEAEASAVLREVMAGEVSPVLTAALLTSLRQKGETVDEVTGFARVMREHVVAVQPRCQRLVDTCGTGGGSIPTFNISTTAAFVVSGAGVSVAKHGNRAITSKCGSADVLEALGVRLDLTPEALCRCIEEVGIGFLFAQAHHPAMRHVGPVRRELPYRTVFNVLGPLTNPAGAHSQVIGVYEERLVPLLSHVLARLGCRSAMVVYGLDSLDELSTLGTTLVGVVRDGEVSQTELTPESVGLRRARPEELAPGETMAENAALTRSILSGEPGPRREMVLLNAAAALVVAGHADDLPAGIQQAAHSIDSGAALGRLEALIAFTRA